MTEHKSPLIDARFRAYIEEQNRSVPLTGSIREFGSTGTMQDAP